MKKKKLNNGISRRDFIKGAAASAVGLAALGLVPACTSAGETQENKETTTSAMETQESKETKTSAMETQESKETKTGEIPAADMTETGDVVIIGSGPAGLACAVEAAEAGLKVILVEKTSRTGGAANFGMGPLGLNTALQAEQGETIEVDEAYNMFMEYTHYRVDGELVYRYFDLSNETIEWLKGMGVVFQEAARYFDKSYPSWHIVESDDGTVGGGQAATMMRRLTERAEELGVVIHLDTPADQIIMENGAAAGVMAANADDGTVYRIDANAVLVATGGFGNNVEMIKEELDYTWGEDYFGMKFEGHEGDGMLMAWDAGAAKEDTNIEMIFNIYANDGPNITNDVSILMRQPGLLVNQEGYRFFNEEQLQNTTYTGNALVRQTGNTGYMILSQAQIDNYIQNGVDFTSKVYHWDDLSTFYDTVDELMAEDSPSVYKGETLEDVAEFFGIDAENLAATVEDYNAICTEGHDPLGKSAEFLNAIESGPYYAAQYFPGSYGTLSGIKINTDLCVVDEDNVPIKGLYSAGTDSCAIFGDSYMFLLPGNTMGYCLNSGRLAARTIVKDLASGE